MRQLGLLGLVVSVLLGAITVGVINDNVRSTRTSQDQALQAAVTAEVTLVANGEHQTDSALSLMLVNPAVRALLKGATGSVAAHRSDVRDVSEALAAIRSDAALKLSDACLDNGAGRQLACAQSAHPVSWPVQLGRQFAALAGTSRLGSATGVFISPVTHQPSIALLAPALSGGRLLGFVHLDLGIVSSLRSLVVNNVPGVSVGLATYSHGQLLINTIPGRVADTGLGASGVVELGDERPGSRPLIAFYGGHRAMAAALPITFGLGHRTTVAFATEQAANPTFGDTISTGEEIVLALAILMLIGSIAGLSVSQRRMTDELATDPLTGLRNRRALMADLPRACQQASERAPAYLWLFDLNGFKRYNDSFGHVAGDTLLTRLGYRLRETVGEAGETYRLGGDEFCVLIRASVENPHELFSEAREALTEAGGGFTIDASGGVAEIPREGDEAEQVLRIADQRMYRDKAGSRAGAAEVIGAVLHAALAQRHPELSGHSDEVAGDVELLAHAIGLGDDDVAAIMKAGDLHDVGKLGIPDEILTKPGPLTDREWEFMKRHTVMGEQIIDAAGPSLGPVGSLVRASHERWDGMGYPDGLRGEEIPLGARIITICDSFRAMLDRRPYKPPMAVADAVAELRRCAGTQFDPYLVDVFCSLIERQASLQEIGSAASNAYAWHPAELSSRP